MPMGMVTGQMKERCSVFPFVGWGWYGVLMQKTPKTELDGRMARLRARLDVQVPEWRQAVVMGRVNLFYLTGTMQDGVLTISRQEGAVLWVRRSFERAVMESALPDIRPMQSFRDISEQWEARGGAVLVETESVPMAHFGRFDKYFGFDEIVPLDVHLLSVRAVKSAYELALIRRSGELHRRVTEDLLPEMLCEGMSEAELGRELMSAMLEGGHHGVARTRGYNTELFGGQICFGESSLVPHGFNGPGGVQGLGAAMPMFGSRERLLKRGDLVSVDVGCGVDGYHTDKTVTYRFGAEPTAEMVGLQAKCVALQDAVSAALRPGRVPSELYAELTDELDAALVGRFMNCGGAQVTFLGHGVGLHIDEFPVIAKGFDEPMEAGMVLAVEPKAGIEGVGMVGIENTFVVTADGGESVTGDGREIGGRGKLESWEG